MCGFRQCVLNGGDRLRFPRGRSGVLRVLTLLLVFLLLPCVLFWLLANCGTKVVPLTVGVPPLWDSVIPNAGPVFPGTVLQV